MTRSRALGAIAAVVIVLAAVACLRMPPAKAQEEGGPFPLDPAVARCILDRLYGVETPIVAQLIYEACRALVEQNGTGGLMVHCRVPGDPSWIETRLLTREQCARAGGAADR